MDNKKAINILLLGDTKVGKTCFVNAVNNGVFNQEYFPTIVMDVSDLIFNKSDNMVFWDSSGEEMFRFIIVRYIEKMDIILLFFDLENRQSFTLLTYFLDIVEKYDKKILLIGNKSSSDKKEVTENEAFYYAYERNLHLIFIDCKHNVGILLVLNYILKNTNIQIEIPKKSLLKKLYYKFTSQSDLKNNKK